MTLLRATAGGWVNARITLVLPLDDVKTTDGRHAKQEAAGRVLERVIDALPKGLAEHVAVATWEDMHDEESRRDV